MNEEDIFKQTGDTYLRMIHAVPREDFPRAIVPVVDLAPSVPDDLVSALILGASWRERLLGLSLAMAKCPSRHTDRTRPAWHRDRSDLCGACGFSSSGVV